MEKTTEKKAIFITKERIARLLPSFLVALAIALIVFLAAPLAIYTANINEFNFPFSDILGYLFLFFAIALVAVFLIQALLPKIGYKIVRGFFLGVALMLFLQSNYLNIGLHSLAGDDIITVREMVGNANFIINTIVWVVVIVGFTLASTLIKKQNIVKIVALVVSVVVLFTTTLNVVVSLISTDFSQGSVVEEIKKEEPNYVPKFLTTKNMTSVASSRNVVMFLVDRFDTKKYFEPVMDDWVEYFEELGGFTYFEDNISMYGRTYPSVGYMLTGKEFNPEERRKDFFIRTYNNNNTLSRLHNEGYSVNIYTDPYYGYYDAFYLPDYIDNVVTVSEDSLYRETLQKHELFRKNMMMSLYRTFPFAAKDIVGGISSTSLNKFVVYRSNEMEFDSTSSDMRDVYKNISSNDFTKQGEKKFSFIHLSGCHTVDYDKNWKPIKGLVKKDMKDSIHNSFAIIKEYIDEMKKQGVYENSTIIITGDHAFADTNYKVLSKEKLTALFVKPAGDTEKKFKVSSAPVCQDDLWATIFKSENIAFDESEFGKSAFDYSENEERIRKHVWHNFDSTKTRFIENIYEIKGSARQFKNWNKVSSKTFNREIYD